MARPGTGAQAWNTATAPVSSQTHVHKEMLAHAPPPAPAPAKLYPMHVQGEIKGQVHSSSQEMLAHQRTMPPLPPPPARMYPIDVQCDIQGQVPAFAVKNSYTQYALPVEWSSVGGQEMDDPSQVPLEEGGGTGNCPAVDLGKLTQHSEVPAALLTPSSRWLLPESARSLPVLQDASGADLHLMVPKANGEEHAQPAGFDGPSSSRMPSTPAQSSSSRLPATPGRLPITPVHGSSLHSSAMQQSGLLAVEPPRPVMLGRTPPAQNDFPIGPTGRASPFAEREPGPVRVLQPHAPAPGNADIPNKSTAIDLD